MMDEQLIDEVAQHAVIYNRQKYYLNGSVNGNGGPVSANKYETKDEAWTSIAMKLRSDVETCKKRWKYLRERYVSQRKQGDPPVYEHLSRPYLEKMKFLDSHIQPRKSYRNVPSFLTSPHSANSSNFNDYNMDSKSNSSMKSMGHFGQHSHHFQEQQHAMNALSTAAAAASAIEGDSRVKLEADQVFRDFAAAVASQHLQQISQSQIHQQSVAAAMAADSPQNYNEHFREAAGSTLSSVVAGSNMTSSNGGGNGNSGLHSSSSSIKSPLSSPLGASNHHNGSAGAGHAPTPTQQTATHSSSNAAGINGGGSGSNSTNHHFNNHSFNDTNHDDLDSSTSSNYNMKKPRVQLSTSSSSSQLHNSNNQSHHNSHNNINASNNNAHFVDDSEDEDTDDNSSNLLQPQTILNEHHTAENPFQTITASTSSAAAVALQRSHTNNNMNNQNNNNHNNSTQSSTNSNMFSSNADFLFQLYQQLPQHHHTHPQQHNSSVSPSQQLNKFQVPSTPQPTIQRSSEHLLGELVTTELLKMSKERRKNVQKRILEILFFDD